MELLSEFLIVNQLRDGLGSRKGVIDHYRKGHVVHAAPVKPAAVSLFFYVILEHELIPQPIATDFFGRTLVKKPSAIIDTNGESKLQIQPRSTEAGQ